MKGFDMTSSRIAIWLAALVMIAFAGTQLPEYVAAQEPAVESDTTSGEDATSEDDAESDSALTSLGEQIFKSPESTADWFGIAFYIVLAIFSIYAATVVFERLVNLKRENVVPQSFVNRLRSLLSGGQDTANEFKSLCDSSPSPIANILRSALKRAGRPLPEVEKAMEDAAVREVSVLRAKHRPLSVAAAVAPLIGLLGTVVGMIFAFQVASEAGLSGGGERLASGLYVALLTTAGGLSIAIPCLLFVSNFNTRVERFFRDMEDCLTDTLPSFAKMESSVLTGVSAVAATSAPSSTSAIADEQKPETEPAIAARG
jgi:biopolymer transport protein ExbB